MKKCSRNATVLCSKIGSDAPAHQLLLLDKAARACHGHGQDLSHLPPFDGVSVDRNSQAAANVGTSMDKLDDKIATFSISIDRPPRLHSWVRWYKSPKESLLRCDLAWLRRP